MNTFITLAVFEYSTEAHLVKSKLDSEGIRTLLFDEKTIDSDPLISQAIGGVKLKVVNEDVEKALKIYNKIRKYKKDVNGSEIHCKECNSTRILIAPTQRKNIFYMLFPFFEKRRHICNDCKTVF
ncbi:MAG: DUF2007 domain-containing protein [Flavobacteriaceae bacterium]|nr:DUF2007 domain-containing protein [Flavobacteriaceae bacterium]